MNSKNKAHNLYNLMKKPKKYTNLQENIHIQKKKISNFYRKKNEKKTRKKTEEERKNNKKSNFKSPKTNS